VSLRRLRLGMVLNKLSLPSASFELLLLMILGSPLTVIAIFINGNASLFGSENSDTIRTNRFWTDFILVLKLINQLGYALRLSYERYFVQKSFIHHWVIVVGRKLMHRVAQLALLL
jgi:hypothetical protein